MNFGWNSHNTTQVADADTATSRKYKLTPFGNLWLLSSARSRLPHNGTSRRASGIVANEKLEARNVTGDGTILCILSASPCFVAQVSVNGHRLVSPIQNFLSVSPNTSWVVQLQQYALRLEVLLSVAVNKRCAVSSVRVLFYFWQVCVVQFLPFRSSVGAVSSIQEFDYLWQLILSCSIFRSGFLLYVAVKSVVQSFFQLSSIGDFCFLCK